MDSIEHPIIVENGRSRKRKRDNETTKKALLKKQR